MLQHPWQSCKTKWLSVQATASLCLSVRVPLLLAPCVGWQGGCWLWLWRTITFTVWADITSYWLTTHYDFPQTWQTHPASPNWVIDEAFLDWRGLGKPCISVPLFIMDEKVKNLPRIITQLEAGIETTGSSSWLLVWDSLSTFYHNSASPYLQNGVLPIVNLPVNLFINTDQGKLWALSFYSHSLGSSTGWHNQPQASTDSPAPESTSLGS